MQDGDSSLLRPEHPISRPLSTLVEEFGLDVRGDIDGVEVTGIALDNRKIIPGDVFVGLRGAHRHGAALASGARERGAVAVLTDPEGAEIAADSGLPIVIVESPREALGDISAWVYRTIESPPLLLAVTGTNGKTSVSYLLHGILGQLGLVAGLSTTAERAIGSTAITSELTTPEATEVHGLLARMRENEVRAVTIEVSAQALTRRRVDGIVFDVAAFLNLSRDHFDDYADMEEYFAAKLPLFSPDRAKRAVVSLDSEWGHRVVDECHIPVTTVTSLPNVDADWTVTVLQERVDGTEFELTGPSGRSIRTSVGVIGHHMAANAAVAIVMLVEAGFDLDAIGHVLDRDGEIVTRIPGRVERVSESRGPALFVDYGHSPDAFTVTLDAVRRVVEGRIIMVFGADGDRDSGKRHEMGRIASEGADVLVVTDYNPRFEDPASIRSVLLEGARSAHDPAEIHEVEAPGKAIRLAVSLAGENDAVLWAGPGHEDHIDIRGEKVPFDAREEARLALREAGWS
ncbi:UDP-N-acetylmuramoyl-L-alanyl-D-glutamate--2,6-diaminopimelate ligase [Microbacteriaceae bacterium SG_E_30_P1]|uniref:UDP-N-acetylmuramyl-tripeptide synthetase n=1 Tax=Antiquaquibacter oligotrophicus TaxID=2880260 RepID=A0ABT6KLF0_9MICO|nr:UDP-N-acetylmuramoyl-L-alanyl-D-glutamate--2,6-diaminopimelate ligase [Antiquaquibacter oligotrophicus]MDH6180815.1 UDP-N-acetylmuramoyl-L-alanyl-D-glutamate--2,6-diaminopimelate ligase [Antiquaquibacter oligotrophicus]UDF13468.1 UDP-N-acetylmuramoyl-L-alanyl-D-glutamate--2,6-diaminopimelate ligase [Antiquaquibacter oligotrophicus]